MKFLVLFIVVFAQSGSLCEQKSSSPFWRYEILIFGEQLLREFSL